MEEWGADDVMTAERDNNEGGAAEADAPTGVCAGEALQGPLAAKAVSFTESHVRCCEAARQAEGAAAAAPPPPPAEAAFEPLPLSAAAEPPATALLREESWRVSMLNIFVKSIFRGEEEPKANAPGVLRRLSLMKRKNETQNYEKYKGEGHGVALAQVVQPLVDYLVDNKITLRTQLELSN